MSLQRTHTIEICQRTPRMISPHVLQDLTQVRQLMLHHTVFRHSDKGWSLDEQTRFWDALRLFPKGPWPMIAAHIGTKTTRQAMTHAQKLRQKLKRWRKRATERMALTAVKTESDADHDAELDALDCLVNSVFSDPNLLAMGLVVLKELPTNEVKQQEPAIRLETLLEDDIDNLSKVFI